MSDNVAFFGADDLLCRIRSEYMEMPGLRLTRPQAQRLWGLDEPTCTHILDSLAEAEFLHRTDDGAYARVLDGPVSARATWAGRR